MTWMCFHIHITHFIHIHAQINLRSGNIGMSQHFLDASDVCSILQHMCGKRMSQCMRRDIMLNPGFLCISLQNLSRIPCLLMDFPEQLVKRLSVSFSFTNFPRASFQIFLHGCFAYISYRDHPFLILIVTDYITKPQIEILQIQPQKFTDAHSCSIQKLQHALSRIPFGVFRSGCFKRRSTSSTVRISGIRFSTLGGFSSRDGSLSILFS
mgnify:CR=1 FL=1